MTTSMSPATRALSITTTARTAASAPSCLRPFASLTAGSPYLPRHPHCYPILPPHSLCGSKRPRWRSTSARPTLPPSQTSRTASSSSARWIHILEMRCPLPTRRRSPCPAHSRILPHIPAYRAIHTAHPATCTRTPPLPHGPAILSAVCACAAAGPRRRHCACARAT